MLCVIFLNCNCVSFLWLFRFYQSPLASIIYSVNLLPNFAFLMTIIFLWAHLFVYRDAPVGAFFYLFSTCFLPFLPIYISNCVSYDSLHVYSVNYLNFDVIISIYHFVTIKHFICFTIEDNVLWFPEKKWTYVII